MDSIKAEKLQAMKNYKKNKFLNSLMLHSLTALLFTLLCSYPSWFPHLCSSVKHFASLFNTPNCLFIVGNAIVIFLVGESKLGSSRPTLEESVNKIEEREEEEVKDDEGDNGGVIDLDDHENKVEEERDEEEEEEETGLPTEELNKRVEDFIAKVNRQRWLEARLLDCGRG